MRICRIISLFFALILCFPIPSNAHSGGTDDNGGHYNGDDYHYHHGYPAHDHYDMDGDGDTDCPYNFHDNVDYDRDEDIEDAPSLDHSTATIPKKNSSSWSDTAKVIVGILLTVFGLPFLVFALELLWAFILFIKNSCQKFIPKKAKQSKIEIPNKFITIPKQKTPKTRVLIVAAIFTLALLVAGCVIAIAAKKAHNADKNSLTAVTNTPAAEPASGHTFNFPSGPKTAPLSIKAHRAYGYYFVLEHQTIPSRTTMFYVQSGAEITIWLAPGPYRIYYATGEAWYGEEQLFGAETKYLEYQASFLLSEHRTVSDCLALDVYPTYDVNHKTRHITADEFPK